jgi:hypothetical protein
VWTLSRSLPWLLARFPNYESFSRVAVAEVLGEHRERAQFKEAAWLETSVLLNRGDAFEVRALPWPAQAAPAFAAVVADFNGDSHEDVFLSQNFFAVRADDSRYDAGRGLLLLGEGTGSFGVMDGSDSGLKIYGEQRGAAACDYDGDGRLDLAVVQHGGRTRLFHNETARTGIRVHLEGPAGNPQAIGAKLRVKTGEEMGPVREIRAGSGYWSQDGALPVLARPANDVPRELWVQWPNGEISLTPMEKNAKEISIAAP